MVYAVFAARAVLSFIGKRLKEAAIKTSNRVVVVGRFASSITPPDQRLSPYTRGLRRSQRGQARFRKRLPGEGGAEIPPSHAPRARSEHVQEIMSFRGAVLLRGQHRRKSTGRVAHVPFRNLFIAVLQLHHTGFFHVHGACFS